MTIPPLQVHLVLTFGISPLVYLFFPFCQQKKITLLPALSITEISTCGCNYKGPNEGISFAGSAGIGENHRRRLINQALGSRQSWPLSHVLTMETDADLPAGLPGLQTRPPGWAERAAGRQRRSEPPTPLRPPYLQEGSSHQELPGYLGAQPVTGR